MKTYVLSFLGLIFLGFLSTVSLAAPMSTTSTNAANSQVNSADAQKKQGEIIKIVMVIDDNEIDAANLVSKKTSNPNVKKFAQLMIKDHGDNMKELKKIMNDIKVTPLSSDKSIALETNGKNGRDKLDSLQGKELDSVYIGAMVSGHQGALQIIDADLIPNASNPQLLKFLKSTRETVAKHLQLAKETQTQL